MKYFNFKRFKFSTILKKATTIGYNFAKIFKISDYKKIYKYIDLPKSSIIKLIRRLNLRTYNLNYIKTYNLNYIKTYNLNYIKRINFFSNKFLFFHLPGFIIFFSFLYLAIPTFYNYDKSDINNKICKKYNAECLIKGKIKYVFYPTPRIKIKDLKIINKSEKKATLITAKDVSIKLSLKNLLAKEKHSVSKVDLNKYEINYNFKNKKKYKKFINSQTSTIPIEFNKGEIKFFDGKDYVFSINKAEIDLNFFQDSTEAHLRGEFLNDEVHVTFKSSKDENKKINKDILLKISNLNLLAKINLFNIDENNSSGNFLLKLGKNKITSIFDYKENKIKIKKSNLRNTFIDGKMAGNIEFFPYFNFELDVNLNSLNFTKLYNYFLALDKKKQTNFFKINNKINGKINLSSDKIYSRYDLVKSFESRLLFNNGNIFIEQFLLNLGKLGAADILGSINNDKKFTGLKYESNIFVDNQKKFMSKFGIYDRKSIPSNIFVSGNFDLENIRANFYEISANEKISGDDLNFVENEFNEVMLENGYKDLFHFKKFKEFLESATETN